jgi:uncharacterized membrane protein YfcA
MAAPAHYWFMFPACIAIAGVAIFAGISGATLLLPLFFLLFPVFGVQALTPPQAVGCALVLQISAFGLAVYRYATRGLVRWQLAAQVAKVSVPAALLGALVAPAVPLRAFRLVFAGGLLALIPSLLGRPSHLVRAHAPDRLRAAELVVAGGIGGLITGVVSAGVGEATIPVLARRELAMPAIAATATALVALTVGVATATTAGRLALDHQLTHFAWPVVAWGAPGALIGEELAVRGQGRVGAGPVRALLAALFAGISAAFVALALR